MEVIILNTVCVINSQDNRENDLVNTYETEIMHKHAAYYKVGDTTENWIAGLDAIFHNFLLFIRSCDLISHTSNYCPLKVFLSDRF